jgi:hypothetical protein
MSATKAVQSATRQLNAVVVSSGLMQKTVKVRIGVQVWNSHLQKVCISSLSPPIICNLACVFLKAVEMEANNDRSSNCRITTSVNTS